VTEVLEIDVIFGSQGALGTSGTAAEAGGVTNAVSSIPNTAATPIDLLANTRNKRIISPEGWYTKSNFPTKFCN
jgi:hypothetical protein